MKNKSESGLVEKRDIHIQTYMGGDYKISQPANVGQLKAILREIIDDLPEDDELEVSEVWFHRNEINITLKHGITQ